MIKGQQGVTIKANNPNAKYKIVTTKKQTITGNDKYIDIKYTYSRIILPLIKKYSYAV